MKIAAVVILYYPGKDVVANIQSYYPFVEKIFVFDNTETQSDLKDKILSMGKIELFHDHRNEGIARRLNEAVKMAVGQKFDWLLTMDQDTCFSNKTIEAYLNCVSTFKQKEKVAMFGTSYSHRKQQLTPGCSFTQGENLITSGMLLNLSLATKIGSFDENLFIDSVDHDYVIRAKLSGYNVIKFTNIYLLHALGLQVHRASLKTLFVLKKKKLVHSPLRCYYMYRNMLYLCNKFKSNQSVAVALRKMVTGNLLVNIFYGRNAWQTLRYLVKAKSDFKQNRMGKIN